MEAMEVTAAMAEVTPVTLVTWVISATPLILVTFASRAMEATGHTAIGPGGIVIGPGAAIIGVGIEAIIGVGITECVGFTGLGDG
jgi:hypothetical protein